MRFVDRVRILVRAGDGGNGAVAWRRESHMPRGGPAGGDGGRGGSVWLVADDQLSTLLDLRYRKTYKAQSGVGGSNRDKNGKAGEDCLIRVPVGTQVYFDGRAENALFHESDGSSGLVESASELETIYVIEDTESEERAAEFIDGDFDGTQEGMSLVANAQEQGGLDSSFRFGQDNFEEGRLLGDLSEPGQNLLVAKGGKGGWGNRQFQSSTNRSPDRALPGLPGEACWLRLELKLLADVGIVGLPNVGKSTLIRKISRARPKVADYPFTTLVPQLGVTRLRGDRSMVIADVPGLIAGAAEGKGLGHEFLRHLERTRVLLHLLAPAPGEESNPIADLAIVEKELESYGSMFDDRPRVVALNKIDTAESKKYYQDTARALRSRNIPLFGISGHTGEGVDALLEALWRRLVHVRAQS